MNSREEIVRSISGSAKYRGLCPELIDRVVCDMLKKHVPRDAEKAARERLHAVTGAFMTPTEEKAFLKLLPSLPDEDALPRLLSLHASTRERLPVQDMDEVFSRVLLPGTVLDLACGILPVYLACRGYAATGIDVNLKTAMAMNEWGRTTVLTRDLMNPDSVPHDRFDTALALKLLPVLETECPGAGRAMLGRVNARRIVVSFPTRTLGGRRVGMEHAYPRLMEQCRPDGYREIDRFSAGSELFYVFQEV